MLVSRFLLDLQEASQRLTVHVLDAEGSAQSSCLDTRASDVITRQSLVFARMVGSVAAPISLDGYLHSSESEWSISAEAEEMDSDLGRVYDKLDKHGSSDAPARP